MHAALLTAATEGKEPKCPSTDEWTQRLGYIYAKGLSLSHKNKEIMPSAAIRMDLEMTQLSQRNTNTTRYHLQEESKKDTHERIYQRETDSQAWNTNSGATKGKDGARGGAGAEIRQDVGNKPDTLSNTQADRNKYTDQGRMG